MYFKLLTISSYESSDAIERKIASIPRDTTTLGIALRKFNLDDHSDRLKLINIFSAIPTFIRDLDLNTNFLAATDTLVEMCSRQNVYNFYAGKPMILDKNRGEILSGLFSSLHSGITTIRLIRNNLSNLSVDSLKLMRHCLPSVTQVFLSSDEINFMSKMQIDVLSEIFPNAVKFIIIASGSFVINNLEGMSYGIKEDGVESDSTSEKIRYFQNKPQKCIKNTIIVLALLIKQNKLPWDVFSIILQFMPYNQLIQMGTLKDTPMQRGQKTEIRLRDPEDFERIGDQNMIDPKFTEEDFLSWMLYVGYLIFSIFFVDVAAKAPVDVTCQMGAMLGVMAYASYYFSLFSGKFNSHERKLANKNVIHDAESIAQEPLTEVDENFDDIARGNKF